MLSLFSYLNAEMLQQLRKKRRRKWCQTAASMRLRWTTWRWLL